MQRRILYGSVIVLILLLVAGATGYWRWHRTQTASPNHAVYNSCSPCSQTVVLSYEDFGTQVMSYELIGYEWNQWKSEGHPLPDDVDVKVVVYRGIELEKVRMQFPVVKGKSDYRYLDYSPALPLLELQLTDVENYSKGETDANAVKMWEDLRRRLMNTRRVIIESLGN